MADYINAVLCRMMVEWNAFKKQERGAVDLVVIVVLIAIGLALAVVFRKELDKILKQLFGQMEQNATEATQAGG